MLPTIWSPFRTLTLANDPIDDLLEDLVRFHPVLAWSPSMDVSDDEKKITVRAELPGIDPEDLQITIEDHRMILRGEKKSEKKENGRKDRWSECFYGAFSRTLALPKTVDTKKIKARLKNGILEITLPKRAEAAPKKIPVHLN